MKFKIILSVIFFFAAEGIVYPQQIIGTFPELNGGLEGEVEGSLVGVGSIDTVQSYWTTQFFDRGEVFLTGGRSGPSYVRFTQDNNDGSSVARLHTPTTVFQPNTSYVIQFFYQGDIDDLPTSRIRGGLSWTMQIDPVYGSNDLNQNTGSEWNKYTRVITTGSFPSDIGVGVIRIENNGTYNIDDFVIYKSTEFDNVPPPNIEENSVVTIRIGNDVSVSWAEPADMSDVAGYLVLRTEGPRNIGTDVPVQNGIYSVSNTIGGGLVRYIGTETSFVDVNVFEKELDYKYYIWSVDKAFNYSESPALPVSMDEVNVVNSSHLSQNYPNPFNPTTKIEFSVNRENKTSLIVYDVLGNKIEELFNSNAESGKLYEVLFNASSYASGMYYYKLTSGSYSEIKKMILVK